MSSSTKSKDNKSEPIAYSDAALRNNAAVVEYSRTSMAALSGSTAGVLGLTGLYGFAFYVFSVIILWVMFMIKAGPNWNKYYVSRQSLLTNGFFGALFTYVLFWTFIYALSTFRVIFWIKYCRNYTANTEINRNIKIKTNSQPPSSNGANPPPYLHSSYNERVLPKKKK